MPDSNADSHSRRIRRASQSGVPTETENVKSVANGFLENHARFVADTSSRMSLRPGAQRSSPPDTRMPSPLQSSGPTQSQTALDGTQNATSHAMADAESDTQLPKKITHLIDLTDKVLTIRTQMQHEEETQDQYQRLLSESTQFLMTAFTSSLPRHGVLGSKRPKKTQKRKGEAVQVEDENCGPVQWMIPPPPPPANLNDEDTGPTVTEDTGPGTHTAISADPVNILLDLYRKYQSDYEALNLQRAKLGALRNQLTTLEYRLRKRQEEFLGALDSMVTRIPELGTKILADVSMAMGSFSSSEKSKSEAPTLLAAYFDRKGDIGIFRDRLVELDYYFQEGHVEREYIVDRGDPLETSDEQFEAEYRRARRDIERDLNAAEQETANLAARCIAAGIDISTTRKASSSNASSNLAPSIGHMTSKSRQPNELFGAVVEGSKARPGVDRVHGWLTNIPDGLDVAFTPEEEQTYVLQNHGEDVAGPIDGTVPDKVKDIISGDHPQTSSREGDKSTKAPVDHELSTYQGQYALSED